MMFFFHVTLNLQSASVMRQWCGPKQVWSQSTSIITKMDDCCLRNKIHLILYEQDCLWMNCRVETSPWKYLKRNCLMLEPKGLELGRGARDTSLQYSAATVWSPSIQPLQSIRPTSNLNMPPWIPAVTPSACKSYMQPASWTGREAVHVICNCECKWSTCSAFVLPGSHQLDRF